MRTFPFLCISNGNIECSVFLQKFGNMPAVCMMHKSIVCALLCEFYL